MNLYKSFFITFLNRTFELHVFKNILFQEDLRYFETAADLLKVFTFENLKMAEKSDKNIIPEIDNKLFEKFYFNFIDERLRYEMVT